MIPSTDHGAKLRLLVAGGDLRQITAAEELASRHLVTMIGFDTYGDLPAKVQTVQSISALSGGADALILPMPVTQDGVFLHAPYSSTSVTLSSLLPAVRRGGAVLGGRITQAERQLLTNAGLTVQDYSTREEFAVRNAVPTAEGALQIAMQELPVTLHGLPCLILGAGRVSRALQSRLRALGAEVTVAARRHADLAWCAVDGCCGLPFSSLDTVLPKFPLIVNTVPALVLSAERLMRLQPRTLVLDLASKPGGDGVGDISACVSWRHRRNPRRRFCHIPTRAPCSCGSRTHRRASRIAGGVRDRARKAPRR